jgi:hypothetical protein
MLTLITMALAIVAGIFGPGDAAGYVPCQWEDGSGWAQPFPCIWDAQTRGNGLGQSIIIHADGRVTLLTEV